jgi:hypothetical protein
VTKAVARSPEDYNVKAENLAAQGWSSDFMIKNNILHKFLHALDEEVIHKL